MIEFDPLNSPSRTATDPIVSNSPFSSLFAHPPAVVEPSLIDFTSSPCPPAAPEPSRFEPKPLSLGSARQTLFPPASSGSTKPRRASPLKFSVLEDSFSDFPPSFAEVSSGLGPARENDCDEGGLVSFVQDSPPPSLSRTRGADRHEKENASPTRRSAAGKKWGVMSRLKEDRARRRSRSLSPVKEPASSPFNASTVGGDSIAQIGNVDLSLIQDEGGSFLLADDDYSTVGQSFDNDRVPCQSPGNLSQIGEEEEEEEEEEEGVRGEEILAVEEGISVGLSTMFLNKPSGDYDLSLIGDQSKLPGSLAPGARTFDQSTLPRNFQPSLAPSRSTARSNSSAILPPELVSPVKARSNASRPLPPSASKPFHALPTPAPSPPSISEEQSQFSINLPPDDQCSFLNKSSQSFIQKCKTPRKAANKGRVSDMSDVSEEGGSASEFGSSRGGLKGERAGETTEFGFTQWLANRDDETSTAIVNQLPPTSIFNPESTRTIELCLQPPLRPDNNGLEHAGDRDELASSTRTVRATEPQRGDEVDLMGMEEPSLLFQNQTLAFAGDLTMENQSMLVPSSARGTPSAGGGGGGGKETGAERLKRRMAELRAQQTLYTIPATPGPSASTRFVSLLDQTPQATSRPAPGSAIRRTAGPTPARSRSENTVGGARVGGGGAGERPGVNVGTLISFDTPSSSASRLASSSSHSTPARLASNATQRRLPRASLAASSAATPVSRSTTTSSISQTSAPKTPGERKETTRARLERMRTERKQREDELLRHSASPAKPGAGGATGLKRSNSVGTRLTTDKAAGIARSQSSSEIGGASSRLRQGTSSSDIRAGSKPHQTLTERMIASSTKPQPRLSTALRPPAPRPSTAVTESMPPPVSTARRSSLLPPSSVSTTSSSSRLVKRQSLLPSTSSAATLAGRRSSIVSRPPLKPTTGSAVPAGSGLARK
ncbi:hypothetical protein JCM11491_001713 [Sporobolomyces phaffii]